MQISQSSRFNSRVFERLSLVVPLSVSFWWIALPAIAQITPDNTLGAESSRVLRDVEVRDGRADRIDGGAIRAGNLFHSFSDFNVNELQRVYFSNPAGIENILSRVTGGDRSDILGTLGVDGDANLFLLNPNGIVFGPNATLDIRGSFVATTADRFTFPDGSSFSATNPEGPPLLMVNVPIGLQYGQEAPQGIVNEAQLIVGQDLMLSGGTVDSAGSLVAPHGDVAIAGVAGDVRVQNLLAQSATLMAFNNLLLPESRLQTAGDLTLLAGNTVWARDSVTNPFWAIAGGDLHIQGNQSIDILALNHLYITPFQSGGTLSLISDGIISGDAHFVSGGNFSILDLAGKPGNFVSLYDPIVSVDGDVVFGAYTGASLKIEATGSIIATGNITITRPDAIATGNVTTIGNVSTPLNLQDFTISNDAGSVSASILESFLGLTAGSLSGLGNGTPTVGSAVEIQVDVPVGGTQAVSFNWDFFTTEGDFSPFNDFSFVSIPQLGIAGTLQELADTNTFTRSGTQTFTLPGAGTPYTVGIGVVNVADEIGPSSVRVTDFLPGVTLTADPDISILNASPALILRAGLALDDLANPPGSSVPDGFTLPPPAGPTDPVLTPGSIIIGSVANPILLNTAAGGGGPIILDAQGDVVINGDLDTSFDPTKFDGGLVPPPLSGNGGRVEISSATGNVSIAGTINSSNVSLVSTGSAGNVSILAETGAISLTDATVDTTINTTNGSAGQVTIQAAGDVTLSATDIDTSSVGLGAAGNILIQGSSLMINDGTTIQANSSPANFSDGVDTELFLFNSAGDLLFSNDDSDPDLDGAEGSISSFDSFLNFTFAEGGTYVLGVGAFDSYPNGDPDTAIAGNTLQPGQLYNLHVSLDDRVNAPGTGTVVQAEPNNTISTSQVLLDTDFSLLQNNTIQDSTTVPHLTILGNGTGTFDYYSFDVTAGTTGIFDIDTDVTSSAANGGTAGNIRLIANTGAVTIQESLVENALAGPGRPGVSAEIEVRGSSVAISGTPFRPATIDSSTSGGNAGTILINATNGGAVQISGNTFIQSDVSEGASGNGGNIVIRGGSATLSGGANTSFEQVRISSDNAGSGQGGNISLDVTGPVAMTNSVVSSDVIDIFEDGASGDGGNVQIRGTRVEITDSTVNATTEGTGDGGSIAIEAIGGGLITVAGSTISTETSGTGSAGDISITGGQLLIQDGTKISAAAIPAAIASNTDTQLFLFSAAGTLLASNDDSDPSFDGAGGSTSFLDSFIDYTFSNAGTYVIGLGAFPSGLGFNADAPITGNTLQSGEFYNLHVSLSSVPTLDGVGVIENTESNNTLSTAQVLLAGDFSRSQNSNIQDSTTLSHLTIEGEGNGTFNYYSFTATAGSRGIFDIDTDISGERGQGTPGDITLTANAGNLDIINSDISSQAGNTPATAAAAQITIQAAGDINLSGTDVRADTTGTADAGTIAVRVLDGSRGIVTLQGGTTLTNAVQSGATGEGGDIAIRGNSLRILDETVIRATNAGPSVGGEVSLEATNQRRGEVQITDSRIETAVLVGQSTDSRGSNLRITAPQAIALTDTTINATTEGAGQGGDISFNVTTADGEITLTDTTINATTEGSGRGGDIAFDVSSTGDEGTGAIALTNTIINATTEGAGQGGDITFNVTTADGEIALTNTTINATTEGAGRGGSVSLQAGSGGRITLRSESAVVTEVAEGASGIGGDIEIGGRSLTITDSSQFNATTAGTAEATAGTITASVRNLTIDGDENTGLFALSTSEADAGTITINSSDTARGEVNVTGGRISVAATGLGSAGDLEIFTGQLSLTNNGQVTVSTVNGRGGDLRVGASDSVSLRTGGQLLAQATGRGSAGAIEINSPSVEVIGDDALISASNVSNASGRGNILLGGIERLVIRDGQISVSTQTGTAGDITIDANPGSNSFILLEGDGALLAEAQNGEAAIAGQIEINGADSLSVRDDARISSEATGSQSQAGTIIIDAQQVALSNNAEISSEATGTRSQAGTVVIQAESVILQNQAAIASSGNQRRSRAGDIQIRANDILLQDDASISTTVEGRNGVAGGISLLASGGILLQDQAQILSEATGLSSTAGRITIEARDFAAQGRTEVSSQATGDGASAGAIRMNVDDRLVLSNRATVSASSESGTRGGDISLLAGELLTVRGNAEVSVSSESGQAGDLSVNAGAIALVGGELRADSEAGSGGDIGIQTSFLFLDNGRITTNAGNGGGNITINLGTLSAEQISAISGIPLNVEGEGGMLWLRNNSSIEARASGGQGGTIDINIDAPGGVGLIVMENESLISAEALGDANGGNINISIDAAISFILALLAAGPDGSDIIARADRGNGGIIEFTAQELLGIAERPAIPGNRRNDIDASSDSGQSGVVIFNTLGIDPSRGLEDLPLELVSAPPLDAVCGAQREEEGQSTFVVSGREGLPASPAELGSAQPFPPVWVSRSGADSAPVPEPEETPEGSGTVSQIMEAQGWIVAADGSVALVSAHDRAEPSSPALPVHPACAGGNGG